jgi:hypothetical protein
VSTIFVTNALGFICAAAFINSVTIKFGRSKALLVSETFLLGSYITLVLKPPFPVVVAA